MPTAATGYRSAGKDDTSADAESERHVGRGRLYRPVVGSRSHRGVAFVYSRVALKEEFGLCFVLQFDPHDESAIVITVTNQSR